MENCNKIRDIVLTDYLDGQMDLAMKQQLERHLHECSGCKAFALEAKENLSMPFQKISSQKVPVDLWQGIKEKIQKEQYPNTSLLDIIIQRLEGVFTVRFMPALGSIVMLIFVGSTLLLNQQVKQANDKQADSDLADMYVSTWIYGQVGSDPSTPIEQYSL